MSLKAAIYDPYLDTLGGGERYCLTVAEILSKSGYQVDIFWSGNQELLSQATSRFGLNLENIKFVPDIFGLIPQKIDCLDQPPRDLKSRSLEIINPLQKINKFIQKIKILSQYDILFYLSDGSIPFLFAKKNILHVQVPFITIEKLRHKILNFIKILFINKVVCNSQFTSRFLGHFPASKLVVIHPPVDIASFYASPNKQNIILSVGRFDNVLNAKKQDVLIEVFKLICKNNPGFDWKLILMGGSREDPKVNNYLNHLRHLAENYPIEFIVNPDFDNLKEIYSISKIYWHAAGYGVEEMFHPEETEHFGMTVVEAMDSGLVPLVVAKGGLTEIVKDGQNGYTWQTTEELVAKTQLLLASPEALQKMSHLSQDSSQNFSKKSFEEKLLNLIN